MATVTYPDGRRFEIDDYDPELRAYYEGEGASVESDVVANPVFPRVFDGTEYVEVSAGEAASLAEQQSEAQLSGDSTPDAQPAGDDGEQPVNDSLVIDEDAPPARRR